MRASTGLAAVILAVVVTASIASGTAVIGRGRALEPNATPSTAAAADPSEPAKPAGPSEPTSPAPAAIPAAPTATPAPELSADPAVTAEPPTSSGPTMPDGTDAATRAGSAPSPAAPVPPPTSAAAGSPVPSLASMPQAAAPSRAIVRPAVPPWRRPAAAPRPATDLPLEPAISAYGKSVARLTPARVRVDYLRDIVERGESDMLAGQSELGAQATALDGAVGEVSRRWGLAPGSAGTAGPADVVAEVAYRRAASLPPTERARLTDLVGFSRTLVDAMSVRQRAVAGLTATVRDARTELDRFEAEIAQLARDTAGIVQSARSGPRPESATTGYLGGALRQPVSGSQTSPFGSRFDPYYHRWQVHEGIDIAAGYGDRIVAAAPGRVVSAGWQGGYGNLTCLDHGRFEQQTLWTCYAHQSRFLVAEGQTIAAGQPIGEVGSTGASTGPHLHFEVRVGGDAVDPQPWLSHEN